MIKGEIIEELKAIKKDLEYVKANMVDIDFILTPNEERLLEKSIKEFEEGKTVRLEKFKRE